jgi:type I restriction enzyme M protein
MLGGPITSQIVQRSENHEFAKLQNQLVIADAAAKVLTGTLFICREATYDNRLVGMDDIAENDLNLNVPRYVDTTEPEEPIDVSETLQELDRLAEERRNTDYELREYIAELKYL